jgi:hypothetical protein
MNKRLQQLKEQAEFVGDRYALPDEFAEKFAELIVRECADIVADEVDHREPASTYVDKIREHFGVEE